MGLENELGTITRGKKAHLVLTHPIPSIEFMPYAFGSNKVKMTILAGEEV
jgi:imidazolonepropionase